MINVGSNSASAEVDSVVEPLCAGILLRAAGEVHSGPSVKSSNFAFG